MTVAKHESGYKSTRTLGAAEMLVAFLNTRPHADKGEGLFSSSGPSNGILNDFAGLAQATPADRTSLRSLRDALALTVGAERTEAERAWSEVSRLIAPVTVRRVFTVDGVRLESIGGGAALSGIAAAVQTVVEADAWPRLRICPNHDCDLVFYDATRSRTQKWDSYETCGNRANVSAHRARKQERQAG
jgi:hypothetical protein